MRLQMLQVARLAPNLLHDAADLVAEFVLGQLNDDGGFRDRQSRSDLYYSVFGAESLVALRREAPAKRMRPWLQSHGPGEGLDLIHAACLARCWANLPGGAIPEPVRRTLRGKLAEHRTADGGYHVAPGAAHGSAYGCFLATGASQDIGDPPPDAEGIAACLQTLATGDGGYANDLGLRMGNTPATAAAVTLQHQLELGIDPRSVEWLLGRCHDEGGFFAMPEAPIPDLLSTAVALHALSAAQADIGGIREKCIDFVDTLWTSRGSFYGNWAEDTLDTEYTWYGLLSLGHLAV